MNIVELMISTIKAKIVPFFTKVRMWMKPSYVKNKGIAKFRTFFLKILDVKPKDEHDYYAVGGWLFSKRLAFAVVLIICVLCGGYIWMSKPDNGVTTYKAYKYNAIPLKFIEGKVEILAKSGYTAYVGDVSKGVVCGTGTLYDKEGNMVYAGEFDANAYNGKGRLYYPNQNLKYEGEFLNNLYNGDGKEYRKNGSLLYHGAFQNGKKEGAGELYDYSEKLIYTGTFHQDEIYYPELLEKSTKEINEIYTGIRGVYQDGKNYCVDMEDISAVYCGNMQEESLTDEWIVSKIYVLKQEINVEGKTLSNIQELKKVLGKPSYEGNTNLELPDEIALNIASKNREEEVLFGEAQVSLEEVYDHVWQIKEFDKKYMAYLYVFEKDDIIYQFFCRGLDGGFSYYSIER